MSLNVVELASQLVAIPSETPQSNGAISEFLEKVLVETGFTVERLSYTDPNGEEKVNLVAKKGDGSGGLGLFSHSDTVPGDAGWEPFTPRVQEGKLYGRGSCDMKGPLAATIVAAARFDAAQLAKPLFIAVTADEENGHVGSYFIVDKSKLLTDSWPQFCVVCEPSELVPVYAHKGGARITVTAHGVAAHTSTDRGESANFKIAPFLAEMAELAQVFRREKRFQNDEFSPPTNGFNLVLDDGGTAANVTAAKTVATLGLRAMPNAAFGGRADGGGAGAGTRAGCGGTQPLPLLRGAGQPGRAGGLPGRGRRAGGYRALRHRSHHLPGNHAVGGPGSRPHRPGPHRGRVDRHRPVGAGGGGL